MRGGRNLDLCTAASEPVGAGVTLCGFMDLLVMWKETGVLSVIVDDSWPDLHQCHCDFCDLCRVTDLH